MERHFVTFLSPGTFFSEETEKPIDSWDIDKAVEMSRSIKERYGAIPYGFYFTTRARNDDELDSKRVAKSNLYYLGGRIETIEEVIARNDPDENILRKNMINNNVERIVVNDNSWRHSAPLKDDDVILDVNIREE